MTSIPAFRSLEIPPHFNPSLAGDVWKVPYQLRAEEAQRWAKTHAIQPATEDRFKISLVLIDEQITFCIPGYELFVAGRSGDGAVQDSCRLAEFIYHNLASISDISLTLDTHQAIQIFHPVYLVNEHDEHPAPMTLVSVSDVRKGKWRFNPNLASTLEISSEYGQTQLLDYVEKLERQGKYELTIWPYHAMLGGVGHALVPIIEEAVFFHSIARSSRVNFIVKGTHALTESYSAIGPEVQQGPKGETLGNKTDHLLNKLLSCDAMIITGQAKSHCMAFTMEDLLSQIRQTDERLVQKVYLLEDTASPVVVPGVVDYTDQAEAFYERFALAGAHRVLSTQPLSSWPGLEQL